MEQGTILLVDDSPQLLAINASLLRPLGYRIVTASNGPAAIALAVADRPDVVLLDVLMPEMDGYAVTRAMRAHPLLAAVPIILVTALDDRESRVVGFEAGADEFIAKPVDPVELRARIATILRLNRYRRLLEVQDRVAAERARFVWAVDQSPDGVLILGPDDNLHYANPHARQFLGLAPDAPLAEPFLALARRRYTLTPAEAWEGWPNDPPQPLLRLLVRPESRAARELWLRADLLPAPAGDDARVLTLRDVTEQVSTQREMWSFHAMIGHKLRTPLVSILGGLNLLRNGAATMERSNIARITGLALDGARRLHTEVEDILHYLRPPADPLDADRPHLADVEATVQQLAEEFGVTETTITREPADATPQIAIARSGLEIALREVIENAVKFHPQRKPTLATTIVSMDSEVAIRIADNGPGLAPDQLAFAWRPYYQGERTFTGQIEGMGLGLALVARIVHAVGGRCALANRPDIPGAVVTLFLPLAQPEPPAPEATR